MAPGRDFFPMQVAIHCHTHTRRTRLGSAILHAAQRAPACTTSSDSIPDAGARVCERNNKV